VTRSSEAGDWVFAYGSNMDLDDLARWLYERGHPERRPLSLCAAVLENHRLVWNYRSPSRNGGAANVEEAEATSLPGVALLVDEPLLVALDEKEGHPHRYRRQERSLLLDDGRRVTAWVYTVTEAWCTADPCWPRRAYLEVVLRGARKNGLPAWHVEALTKVPTLD
jgi:gamma-glutamylcyclotransferase (GGCT)/AIG2-like uncharacterized protein YtfP